MIVRDTNGTELIRLNEDTLSVYNVSEDYTYSMNLVNPKESVGNPIIAYRGYSDSRIYSVHYENTTPPDFERVYWGGEQQVFNVLYGSSYIIVVSALVIGIGGLYYLRRSKMNKVRIGGRW